MPIHLTKEEANIFIQNGSSKESLQNTINHYRSAGMTDDEIRGRIDTKLASYGYKPTEQAQSNVITPENNIPSQNNPQAVSAPLYPKNGIIEGGIAAIHKIGDYLSQSPEEMDAKFKQAYQKKVDDRLKWEKDHPIVSEFQKSLQPHYSSDLIDWQEKAKYGMQVPLKESFKNDFRQFRANIAPSVNLATLPLGGEFVAAKGAQILNGLGKFAPAANFIASHPHLSKWASTAPMAMVEGAGWGALDKGLREASGIHSEDSLGESMLGGLATMGALHGGAHALGAGAEQLGKTKAVQAIKDGYNALLDSDTALGNTLANIQGTVSDVLGLNAGNKTATKYQKLNNQISRNNTPITKKFSKNDLEEFTNAENLTKEQEDLIFDRLKNGDPKQSTLTKSQEEAKEFFDNLLKEEKQSANAGDDLSHVKSETDVVNPKQEETPLKNDSDMSDDVSDKYKISLKDDSNNQSNFFKQQREIRKKKIEDQRLRMRGINPSEENIVKFDEEGLEALGKEMQDWLHPSKKNQGKVTKLESGSAEGSESGNWYTQEAKSSPKKIGEDDMYENYDVEGTKPTTDEELMQEIEAAKKQKDVPVIRSKVNVEQRTPAQRMFDRRHNEIRQRAWSKKLKERILPLDSDDWSKSKSKGELIFDKDYDVNGSTPIMKSARQPEVKPNAKIRPYKGDAPVGNPEFRDVNTWLKVDINKKSDFNNISPNRSYRYVTENKAIRKLFQGQPMESGKEITRTIGEIADVFPELKKHLVGYDGFEQMKVRLTNDGFSYDTHGLYHQDSRSITLNAKSEKNAETIQHEFQHGKDHFDVLNSPEGSRERALWQSSERRNREYTEFRSKHEDEVINVLQNKHSIDDLTEEEKNLINEYIRLDNRYRNSYAERRARKAGEGVVNGRFGTIQKQPNRTGVKGVQRQSELHNAPRTREDVRGTSGETSHVRDSNATGKTEFYNREPINISGEKKLAPTPQSFIQSIRNSSKAQEKIKIDFDIITEEQAANRLKQQSADGNGTYIKQGYGKSDGKIDLTKDYNEGRNNKVGHFGEKVLEGLKQKGSTKDILIETKKEEIKTQHLKDSIDFIESEFAKPIPENGKIQNGYVPVNRNLLANAIYGNKSTAWYQTMADGEEAIKKAFKNEKVAQAWIDLFKRNSTPDYQLPKQVFDKLFDGSGETVAEFWERYGKDHTGKAMLKTAGAILDAFNNSFKRGVLTSSSFFLNNRFGNQLMIMAKTKNPVEYIKSFYNAGKLKNEDLPSELIEHSILEAVDGYQARQTYTGWQPLDNFLNLIGGHTIDVSTLKTMKAAADNGLHFKVVHGKTVPKNMVESHNAKSIGAEIANACIGIPNKAFNSLCDKLMKLNDKWEKFERRQVYGMSLDRVRQSLTKKTGQTMLSQEELLKHIKEHPELEEVIIKSIENTLGDYNNFNKFEKKVLKRLVPFYSWYRTITRHTATLAKENPARCGMIFLELQRLRDKDKDLKEWQRGSVRTGVTDSRSRKELLVNKTAQIPYSTFKEFIDESGRGGLTPAIKKPIEAVRGKQFFNDSEITSKRYKKFTKGYGKNAQQGYLDKKTGKFKEGELPLMPRVNYLVKEALETVYPIMRSPLIKPEATIQGLENLVKNGEYKEPDKLYDSDLGGYNKGDKFLGKEKRYAANDTSTQTKMINRIFGLSLQNKQPLNKAEKQAYKEKYQRQRKRMRGN